MQYTENYNLRKPEDGEAADNVDVNYNSDKIDTELKAVSDTVDDLAEHYIVEAGTIGDWEYRKWNDGTAECWGHIRTGGLDGVSRIDTWYAGYRIITIPDIFIELPIVNYSCQLTNGYDFCGKYSVNLQNHNMITYFMSNAEITTSTSANIYIHMIGKWQ